MMYMVEVGLIVVSFSVLTALTLARPSRSERGRLFAY